MPFQILALGGSAVQLGIGVAISTGTQVLFILFGGAIVDRLPRRRIILGSDLASGVVVAIVSALGFAGLLRIEHLYVLSGFFGIASAFMQPAMTAIVPELIPADVLVAGNTLRGFSRQAGRIGGPIAAGLLVAFGGAPLAFAFDALTYFISLAALVAMRPAAHVATARHHLLREVREGIAFVFSLPWLWVTIFGFALVNACVIGALVVAMPIYVGEVLHAGAATYGLLVAAAAVGEVAGGLVVAQLRFARPGVAMYLFAAASGAALSAYAILTEMPYLLAAPVAFGAGLVGFGVLWESALQKHVPRALLGRVSSVDYFGALLLGPVAPVAFGLLVEGLGPAPVFLVGGLSVLGLCLSALLIPSIRRLD